MLTSFVFAMTLAQAGASATGAMAFGPVATPPATDVVAVDDESTGVDDLHAAQYLPAPDPVGASGDFHAQPTGCAGLMLGFDQFCLGGLVSRIYSRTISYGLCGALVGSVGGCLLGILPVIFFADGVDGINNGLGTNFQVASGTWLACGLLGAVPGCVSGGGCGAGLGLLSAFLFPFDAQTGNNGPGQQPYPGDQRTAPPYDDYDDTGDYDDGYAPEKKKPRVRTRPGRPDRRARPPANDESDSARQGRTGRSGRDSGKARSGRSHDDARSGRSGRETRSDRGRTPSRTEGRSRSRSENKSRSRSRSNSRDDDDDDDDDNDRRRGRNDRD